MGKDLTHEGRRSWWDGSVTALCGLRMEPGQFSTPFFGPVTCPTCKKLKKSK